MPSPLPYRTVIFDLDGTLVDSVLDVVGAVQKVLVASGLPELDPAQFPLLLGEGARIRTRTAFSLSGVSLSEAELDQKLLEVAEQYGRALLVHTKPYPGIPELLQALKAKGATLAVCTNKDEASARRICAALGLDQHLSDICGSDSFGVQKPHPGHILSLLRRMGISAEGTIMVGDSVHDILAGHRAGLPAAFVSWGYGKAGAGEEAPDFTCASAEELAQVLGTRLPALV